MLGRLPKNFTYFKLGQKEKAEAPMLVTPLPIVTLVSPVQPMKDPTLWPGGEAKPPSIVVTLFGITTLVTAVLPLKAERPITLTGFPPSVEGMTTAPPGPVYSVIVTSLFHVV